MVPQTGFTGSAFSMPSNLVGERFTQNGPQDQENPLFGCFWPISGLRRPRNFSVPQTPKNPVNRELPPQEAKPSKVQNVQKLRNANAVPMGQKNTEKYPVAPSHGRNGVLPETYGIRAQLPPRQNLTDSVNQLGPKGSLLGDPNPNWWGTALSPGKLCGSGLSLPGEFLKSHEGAAWEGLRPHDRCPGG